MKVSRDVLMLSFFRDFPDSYSELVATLRVQKQYRKNIENRAARTKGWILQGGTKHGWFTA